ncbi:CRISPR-associated protein Cas2 [Burkholderia glumae]|uniref:CRISPR-associated protein Cas2 n=1 Tax=Burkholderia glumae TaxID=337 RepID=UPI00157B03C5|nr:CRISPR-associated protein Cas2 [Burkholderia glumae]
MEHTYIISYDIKGSDGYDDLFDAIKKYPGWAHITESTWAITTEDTHTEVRDNLGAHLPKGSRLLVVRSGSAAAWRNTICSNEWLKKNL